MKQMNKQFIGVKFLNHGPYGDSSNITYDYYNDTDVNGNVSEGDVIVVSTQYGPSVAQVIEVHPRYSTNATCGVLEVCAQE
jgi:hypothetical protein